MSDIKHFDLKGLGAGHLQPHTVTIREPYAIFIFRGLAHIPAFGFRALGLQRMDRGISQVLNIQGQLFKLFVGFPGKGDGPGYFAKYTCGWYMALVAILLTTSAGHEQFSELP